MNLRRNGTLRACGIILLAVFLLSLIPICLVSIFDRMCNDDYDFSVLTREAVREEGSAASVFHAAMDTVQNIYQTWQGTYSAVFLFSLQPAIWGQGWYALTPPLLIGMLILGLGVFLRVVCEEILHLQKYAWLSVWMLASILCVQFPRDASEGFFWYNGGVFYTFFFGLLLLWLGLAIRLISHKNARGAVVLLYAAVLIPLSFILAGGNYPVALIFGVCQIGILLWSALQNKKILPIMLLSLAVYGVGFYLNIVAPGNAVRQALLEQQTPLHAVFSAILGTPVRMLGQMLRHPGVPALLLFGWAPLSLALVKDVAWKFRYPLLVPLASWLILAAMFTPSYYAMGNAGSYRLWNIVIFACYLLLMWNFFYFAGWWKRKFPGSYQKTLAFLQKRKRIAPAYLLIVAALSILLSGVGPSIGIERESATSVRAAQAILDGSARTYAAAFDQQAEAIEQATDGEVAVQPIPEPDSLFPDGDLTRYIPKSYEPSQWFDHDLQWKQPE